MLDSRKNFLLIVNSLGYGGNETAAFQLASNINKDKFNCYVLVLNNEMGPMYQRFINNNINVLNIGKSHILSKSFIFSYYSILKEYNIHSVISYVFNYQIVLLQFISIIAGVKKRIVRISAMPINKNINFKIFWIQILSNIFLSHQVAVSNSVKNWLVSIGGFNKKKIVVICNSITINQDNLIYNHNASIKNEINVVMIARMDNAKDFITLISAIAIVQKKYYNTELILLGDGPEKSKIISHANLVECRIKKIGYEDNVIDVLKKCMLFVHSSFSEGFPNVILEAMSVGLPIIASDIPPNREILNNGEFGMIFKVGDHIRLSEIIIDLITNKTKRILLSNKSNKRSLDYKLDKMITEYQNIIEF